MNNAPPLRELQERFAQFVAGGSADGLVPWIVANGIEGAARLQIYRNAVSGSLVGALSTAFPVIRALVGDPFFEAAASRYQAQYPPSSGNLQDYGAMFAQLLGAMPEAASVPYLPDIARLEWARQECYLAPNPHTEPLTPQALAAGALDVTLALAASARIIRSTYPLFDIWMYCQEPSGEAPSLDTGAQDVLVWRDGGQIAMQEVHPQAAVFIEALRDGAGTGRAAAEAAPVPGGEPGFDPCQCLQWLTGLHLLFRAPPSGEAP